MTHRIVIVESNPMYGEGLRSVLGKEPELTIAGIYPRPESLEEKLREDRADLLLLDGALMPPRVPAGKGKETGGLRLPHARTILLHGESDPFSVRKYLKDGVSAYLLRSVAADELLLAIRSVLAGDIYIQERVRQEILQISLGLKKAGAENTALTSREAEVLRLIVEEHTTDEIAEKLFISHYTAESHRKNIIAKLGVRNTAGLVREALRMQLLG